MHAIILSDLTHFYAVTFALQNGAAFGKPTASSTESAFTIINPPMVSFTSPKARL